MALPVLRNLAFYKGDTFSFSFRLRGRNPDGTPGAYIDLSGCTAKAQVRTTEDDASVMAEFDTDIPTQTGDDLGRVVLSLEPEVTEGSSFVAGKWDVQLTWPDGAVKTYLAGNTSVTKEVTRV